MAGDPAGSSGSRQGFFERAEEWAIRLWWVPLLCFVAPLVWGGWWWLLLVLAVPVSLLAQVGMTTRLEKKRAAEREAAAKDIRPGVVLDPSAVKSGSLGSGPVGLRPAASEVLVVDTPMGAFITGGAQARALAYAPHTQVLAVGCSDGQVQLWSGVETPDPICVSTLAHPGALTALGFSLRGRLLVTAGAEGMVTVWDVSLPASPVGLATVVHSGVGPPAAVHSVDVGADGRVATSGVDGRVVVWDLAEPHHPVPVAQLILTCGKPREQATPKGVVRGVTAVSFSPDGRLLAAGGRLGSRRPVQVWDITGPGIPRRVAKLRPHRLHMFGDSTPVCHALAFNPHRPLLVTASEYDYQVCLPAGNAIYPPHSHDSAVVVWDLHDPAHPEGLVTLAERGGDPATGWSNRPLRATPITLAGHADTARCLSISPDGTLLATGDDACLLLWDITDPARPVPRRIIRADGPVHTVTFNPDGRQLSVVSGYGRVTTWSTA